MDKVKATLLALLVALATLALERAATYLGVEAPDLGIMATSDAAPAAEGASQ